MTNKTFEVNKKGEVNWYQVEAVNHKEAVERYYVLKSTCIKRSFLILFMMIQG